MAAPTEWTYDGQLDWSSADSLRLAPAGLVLRVIIEAIKERYAAIGISAPALLAADFNPLAPAKTYIDAVQSAMTTLMDASWPYYAFVNHTIQDGDFTGLDMEALPFWTEADMLAAIGAEERIVLYPLSILSAEWCHQQYQLLNLMRWRSSTLIITLASYTKYKKSAFNYGSTPAIAWNLTKNDIDSTAWSTDWMSGYSWHASNEIHSYDPPYQFEYYGHAAIHLKYSKMAIQNKSNLPEYPSPLEAQTDIYVRTYFNGAENNEWYQAIPNLTLPINRLARLQANLSTPAGETVEMDELVTEYSQPEIPPVNESRNKSFGAEYAGIVSKFDVPGGFKFLA